MWNILCQAWRANVLEKGRACDCRLYFLWSSPYEHFPCVQLCAFFQHNDHLFKRFAYMTVVVKNICFFSHWLRETPQMHQWLIDARLLSGYNQVCWRGFLHHLHVNAAAWKSTTEPNTFLSYDLPQLMSYWLVMVWRETSFFFLHALRGTSVLLPQIQTRIENENYLRCHPEVDMLISNFLR